MLETIRINNFQKHSKLEIELDPKATTIVGPSDAGKSAVIRALRWLCRNFPQGEEFIKSGEKGTTVQVVVDGQKVTRRRGKGTNTYLLGGDEHKSFSTGIPDPIASLLSVEDINFQSQHDAPYWFSLSAGEVSRQINSIVDLGVIDDSLANISKKVRYIQQTSQIARERLAKSRSDRDELVWVVEVDEDYKSVENAKDTFDKSLASAAALHKYLTQAVNALDRRQNASLRAASLRELGIVATQARRSDEQIRDIGRALNQIVQIRKVVSRGCPDFTDVESARVSYNMIDVEATRLSDLMSKLEKSLQRLVEAKTAQTRIQIDLVEKTEGVCPLCGGELDEIYCEEEEGIPAGTTQADEEGEKR